MFLQRKHTNSQQVYEKVSNLSIHQENANEINNEISLHICWNGYHGKKKCRQQEWVGTQGQRTQVSENVIWYSHCGKQ